MKRDMELIRKIVLALEDCPEGYAPTELKIEGFTEEQINYHSYLMIQAGLAEGHPWVDYVTPSPQASIHNLTWDGHEFAAVARNEGIWKAGIERINNLGGGVMTIGILTQVLAQLAKIKLGLN